MIKVAAFTGKLHYPSTRFRVLQYIDLLKRYDVETNLFYTKAGRYPTSNKLSNRIVWGMNNLIQNTYNIIKARNYDVTFMQREMLSTFYTLEGFTKSPRIFDVDDAIFTARNGNAARRIANISDCVICGNNYLANWFEKYNKNIEILPTAVDADRFIPKSENLNTNDDTIWLCWSGSSSGYKFFLESGLLDVLNELLIKYSNLNIRIVSDKEPPFKIYKYEFIKWSPETEVSALQNSHIGLMPLSDDNFARGKCSYKMLTYMSCGLPVIVSPIGMNEDVLNMGDIGYAARNKADWYNTISQLMQEDGIRKSFGLNGRKIILEKFDLKIVSKDLASIIKKVVG